MNLIIGYILMSFFLLADLLILIIGIGFILAIIKGAPFVPAKRKAVAKMIEFADIKPGQKAVDIGSGDGRIVIALARAGAIAHGYEINPVLVWWSGRKIKKAGLRGKAFVYVKNLWSEDFSCFDIVTIFGIPKIMKELGEKLDRELKPGVKIISYGFRFPDWQYLKKEEGVFLYEKK
jgi:protein-L-isoaspartate O-methyltransferase